MSEQELTFFSIIGIIILLSFLTACVSTHIYESIDDYLKTDVPLTYPEHAVFPDEKLLDDVTVEFYQSESQSTFLFDDVYFLLKCTYSQESFQQEIKRLEEIGAVYEDTWFVLPAYIALFRSDRYYEYALVDTENYTIVYVSAEVSDWQTFSDIPDEYLPVMQGDLGICIYDYEN